MTEKIDLDTLRGLDQQSKDAILETIFKVINQARGGEQPKLTKEQRLSQKLKEMKQGEYISFKDFCENVKISPCIAISYLYRAIENGEIGIQICKVGTTLDDINLFKKREHVVNHKKRIVATKKVVNMRYKIILDYLKSKHPHSVSIHEIMAELLRLDPSFSNSQNGTAIYGYLSKGIKRRHIRRIRFGVYEAI